MHITANFLLGKEDMLQCQMCLQLLTVVHILIACPYIETEKNKYFKELYKHHIPIHPSLFPGDDLLVPLSNVTNFLKYSGFLHKL